MTDQVNLDLTVIYEVIWRCLHALERPLVQIQLWGILITFTVSWLTSQRIRIQWEKRFPTMKDFNVNDYKPSLKYYVSIFIRYLLTPLLSLIAISFLKFGFLQLDWRAGLITESIKIFGTFFFYRIFLILCYGIFPFSSVNYYSIRFFIPMFVLFVIKTIVNLFTNIEKLFQVPIIKLFGSPVSLGVIVIITVGIYLWVIGVSIIEQIFLYVFELVTKELTGAAQAISIIIRYFLIGIGIVLVFGYIGFNPTALAAISGGLSVGIGFSLKEIIGNFVSGMGLLFEGSLRPGDIIEVEGELSKVEEINIRATTIKTMDNIEKIVPNQYFFTSLVTTYTGTNSIIRVLIPVGVSYECDPEKVIEILLDVALANSTVLKKPKPSVRLIGYGDSSVDFRLAVFINNPVQHLSVRSDLYLAIWKAFAANNIEIPYPQRDLHIRSDLTK